MKEDKKKYIKFNLIFLFTVVCLLTIIGFINVAVNPYNIFSTPVNKFTRYKPEAKLQERITKIIGFKLDKRKVNTVFLGNSRVDYAIDRDYFEKVTGLTAENLGMGGMVLEEYPALLNLIYAIHPEIKNIFLGVDFVMFSGASLFDEKTKATFSDNPNLTSTEICTALFSFSSLRDSVWTLIKNGLDIKGGALYNLNGTRLVGPDKKYTEVFALSSVEFIKKYSQFKYNPDKIEILRQIKTFCDENGISLYFFVMPTHIVDLEFLYSFENTKDDYKAWKYDVSSVLPLFDFQYPSEFAAENTGTDMKYFFDISHATSVLGNKVIDFMNTGKTDFGRIVTDEYSDMLYETDKTELDLMLLEHKDLADFISDIKRGEDNNAI